MKQKFTGDTLVIATHNAGKLREFRALLGAYVKNIVSAGDLGLPEPEETGDTFAENATLKARAAAEASGHPALADDSGLCVNGLNGAPGIYSARWAGADKNFPAAMKKIHDALGDNPDRSAYFIAVLALAWPDGHARPFVKPGKTFLRPAAAAQDSALSRSKVFSGFQIDGANLITIEGRVDGALIWPPRGEGGHGYDPMFVPAGDTRTFAEMSADEKDTLSHRGRAVRALVRQIFAA